MLSNEQRYAFWRPLMICICITYVTSERFPNAYERSRSGINKMVTARVVLTRGSFYSPRKALEIFPGAWFVTDRRFNVWFIRLNMHFGFEKI